MGIDVILQDHRNTMHWSTNLPVFHFSIQHFSNFNGIGIHTDDGIQLRSIFVDGINSVEIILYNIGDGIITGCICILQVLDGYFLKIQIISYWILGIALLTIAAIQKQ